MGWWRRFDPSHGRKLGRIAFLILLVLAVSPLRNAKFAWLCGLMLWGVAIYVCSFMFVPSIVTCAADCGRAGRRTQKNVQTPHGRVERGLAAFLILVTTSIS